MTKNIMYSFIERFLWAFQAILLKYCKPTKQKENLTVDLKSLRALFHAPLQMIDDSTVKYMYFFFSP